MYGLIKSTDLRGIAKDICDVVGHGKFHTAVDLLIETATVETDRGNYPDSTKYAGMGLTQFDQMPFNDTRDRTSKNTKLKVLEGLGIDIDLVEWAELRYNPVLALLFTRLKYYLVRDEIPPDIEGRAHYWKKWYNSELGKGTIEHYLYSNLKYSG